MLENAHYRKSRRKIAQIRPILRFDAIIRHAL